MHQLRRSDPVDQKIEVGYIGLWTRRQVTYRGRNGRQLARMLELRPCRAAAALAECYPADLIRAGRCGATRGARRRELAHLLMVVRSHHQAYDAVDIEGAAKWVKYVIPITPLYTHRV